MEMSTAIFGEDVAGSQRHVIVVKRHEGDRNQFVARPLASTRRSGVAGLEHCDRRIGAECCSGVSIVAAIPDALAQREIDDAPCQGPKRAAVA